LCGAGVVAPRSSQPWSQLCCLHCQRLCGSVIPASGLWGYVSELLFTVTTLLVHRSLGNSGLRRNNFFVICIEPQQQSQSMTNHKVSTQ
jgi:hypothetical protein